MKRRELKPGDIVRVYGYDNGSYYWNGARGTVKDFCPYINDIFYVDILKRGVVYTVKVHRNQCTPIRIIKKKRRECWINEKIWREEEWPEWFENPVGVRIRTTPPDNLDGWIHLKECKPKK